MIQLTEKNLKALKSSAFPRITKLSQYLKRVSPVDTQGADKNLKSLLLNRDFVMDDKTVLINLASIANPNLDKAKLIKLLRLACDLRPQIAFYGWSALMLRLDIQFGSKACQEVEMALKQFILKHCKAYTEHLKKDDIVWVKPNQELLSQRYDAVLCDKETGKLKRMWVMLDGVYCIHDDFYNALVNYGYTKDQIRGVIHRSNQTEDYSLIPLYLRKKYLVIPDGRKALEKIINIS